MKKLLTIFSFSTLGLLVACGGGESKNPETEARKDEAKQEAKQEDPSANPDYQKGLELVAKSDCFTCHKVNETATGPAYQAVADKYEKTDAVINQLAEKVIKGGSGNWGQVQMIPHPQLSKEDAVAMVKYVMTLKK